MEQTYLPLLVIIPLAVIVPVALVLIARFVAVRNPSSEKLSTYESGIKPMRLAEQRFPVRFYLVAVSFLLFDVETVFLFPWAVQFYELGWFGFIASSIFLFVLVVGLIYEWRKGGLEWN